MRANLQAKRLFPSKRTPSSLFIFAVYLEPNRIIYGRGERNAAHTQGTENKTLCMQKQYEKRSAYTPALTSRNQKTMKNMNPEYIFPLHKAVKYPTSKHCQQETSKRRRSTLRKQKAPNNRKKMQRKIRNALKTEMKHLSKGLQKILADDLVTAFENRIAIIQTAPSKTSQKRG